VNDENIITPDADTEGHGARFSGADTEASEDRGDTEGP
jgi:hypothetical protein